MPESGLSANRSYRKMFSGQPEDETTARIAALYEELSYPSAAKFKAALTKRGIQVSDAVVRQLAGKQADRQLFAPPPRFTGKVVAQHVDDRWAADVIDFQSKTSKKGAPLFVLIVQDIFSRFLFAKALRSKAEVETAFFSLLKETKRKPEELNTDNGSEFLNRSFQAMLKQQNIWHVTKEAPQDLATLDRAIGELRAVLSRRTTRGGPWYDELDKAVKSMNGTEHSALFNRDPDDVENDKDLDFDLRYKNAQMRETNVQLAQTRGETLEQQGSFRTYLPTSTGFKRRAGQQNWSEKIHQVAVADINGRVEDTEGNVYRMSMVKPVPRETAFVAAPAFAMGGSRKVEDRRKDALRQWLPMLLERVTQMGNQGLSVQQAARMMATIQGFRQALKNQRATMLQFAQLWPGDITIEKRGTQNIMRAVRVRPQEPEVVTAVRPREPNLRLRPARQEVTLDRWLAPQEPGVEAAPRPREPNLRLRRVRAPQEVTLDRWRAQEP